MHAPIPPTRPSDAFVAPLVNLHPIPIRSRVEEAKLEKENPSDERAVAQSQTTFRLSSSELAARSIQHKHQ